jgi:hypothetical protein
MIWLDSAYEALAPERQLDRMAMLTADPTLPIALVGAALCAAAYRSLLLGHARASTGLVTGSAWLGRAGLIVLILLMTALGTQKIALWVRTGVVAEHSLRPTMQLVYHTSAALRDWIDERVGAGETPVEIVTRLTEFGAWDSATPRTGLVELLPSLSDTFEEDADIACEVAVTAGGLSEVEAAALPSAASDSTPRPIKYCLRALCWQPPVTRKHDLGAGLVSSHASNNPGWFMRRFQSPVIDGALVPGGFCNADGSLADGYQG